MVQLLREDILCVSDNLRPETLPRPVTVGARSFLFFCVAASAFYITQQHLLIWGLNVCLPVHS